MHTIPKRNFARDIVSQCAQSLGITYNSITTRLKKFPDSMGGRQRLVVTLHGAKWGDNYIALSNAVQRFNVLVD